MNRTDRPVSRPTLDDVDPPAWTWPPPVDTHLVRRCHELRKVPVDALGVEDLRLLIGQEIALPVLLPLALAHLEADPLAEGDLYAGDLLVAVRRVAAERLEELPGEVDVRKRLAQIEVRAQEHQARRDEPWWTPEEIGLTEPDADEPRSGR
ncbi:contact-dependent growth inhibition system immunity protein [Cellulomonas cellasea]|uniref:contact-dependent growth inhibition system immunity protein n=1 Tax=Cellulomonas cellasea TaxID=43670 RepID=UPI0016200F53|nr:contact-dependent growth inhibition system immunity protein [Cellulomonas cellasea]